MDTNWQSSDLRDSNLQIPNGETWESRQYTGGSHIDGKEPGLKLNLETRNCGDVIVVHCQGRIVYRDEAVALSRVVKEALLCRGKLVLDLSGVHSVDSAGMGELVFLHVWAQEQNGKLKYAGPNKTVRTLLELTNLDRVLEVHPSLDAALASWREEQVCADC